MLARGGRTILADIDIDISPREIVTVIGPNGAGKTTLVRALLGLEPLDGGSIRRKPGLVTGYAPQRFDVDRAIPLTVSRFVALGRRASPEDIRGVLKDVGAGLLSERQLSELSGGELQRVVLARALVRSPDLLVLDEPVRGVDYAGEAELYTLIGRLRTERGFRRPAGVARPACRHGAERPGDLPQPACVLLGRAAVRGTASRVRPPVRPPGRARVRPVPSPS